MTTSRSVCKGRSSSFPQQFAKRAIHCHAENIVTDCRAQSILSQDSRPFMLTFALFPDNTTALYLHSLLIMSLMSYEERIPRETSLSIMVGAIKLTRKRDCNDALHPLKMNRKIILLRFAPTSYNCVTQDFKPVVAPISASPPSRGK